MSKHHTSNDAIETKFWTLVKTCRLLVVEFARRKLRNRQLAIGNRQLAIDNRQAIGNWQWEMWAVLH